MSPSSTHIARRRRRNGRHGQRACDLVEAQPGLGADGIPSRKGLPPLNCHIDEAGLDLERVGPTPNPLCRQNGCPGPTEDVEYDIIATRTVPHGVRNQRNRFDRRMKLQLVQAVRSERVDPGVVPDVGPRATVAPQLNVVEVRFFANTEDANQLMLTAVKGALAGIRLYPHREIEHLAVDRVAGFNELADMAPVDADVMQGTVPRDRCSLLERVFEECDEI